MKRVYKILGLFILFLFVLIIKVNAATATLSVNKSSVNVGDTVTATVSYTAAAWDLKVTADSNLTTSSTTQYADTSDSAENVTKSFTISYKAEKAGTAKITLSGNITDESATTSQSVTGTKTVEIKEKETTTVTNTNTSTTSNSTASSTNTTTNTTKTETAKSSNANLKTLGVTPKEYDFTGFKKDKTEYTLPKAIPSTVNKLNVLYKTEDSKATVKVTGNSGFEVGSDNEIKVVVTAEDGKTTKTYTIKVTKLAEEEEQPGNVIEDEKGLYLTSLEIEGLDLLPAFAKDTYSYKAVLENMDQTEVNVKAEANQEKAKIEISGNTNLQEGDNTINIIVTLDGSAEQKVYQIILTKQEGVAGVVTTTGEQIKDVSSTGTFGSLKKYFGILVGVVVFIIVGISSLIVILKKQNDKFLAEEEENSVEEKNEKEKTENTKLAEEYNVFEEDTVANNKETIDEINRQTDEIFKKKGKHY